MTSQPLKTEAKDSFQGENADYVIDAHPVWSVGKLTEFVIVRKKDSVQVSFKLDCDNVEVAATEYLKNASEFFPDNGSPYPFDCSDQTKYQIGGHKNRWIIPSVPVLIDSGHFATGLAENDSDQSHYSGWRFRYVRTWGYSVFLPATQTTGSGGVQCGPKEPNGYESKYNIFINATIYFPKKNGKKMAREFASRWNGSVLPNATSYLEVESRKKQS